MGRRRLRRIDVDGVDYRWLIGPGGEGHVEIRVWRADAGRGQRLDVLVAFDDPWLNYGLIVSTPWERIVEALVLEPVMPRVVRRAILAGLAEGWQPDGPAGSLRFTLDSARERLASRG